MTSTLRLALLATFGLISLGTIPAAQAATQSPLQIVPANPGQNTLPAPAEPDLSTPHSAAPSPISPAPANPAPANQESAPEPPSPESSAPLVQAAPAGTTANYSDGVMSIDFPADWKADVSADGLMITNVTTDENALVATQVNRIAASPGAVVNANIDSFIKEGAAVGRYRAVTIDGQSALVIWLSNRPDPLSSAIATFIGYGNETVLLFSRYSPDNATAEEDVLRLHSSYHNLSAAGAQSPSEKSPPETKSP